MKKMSIAECRSREVERLAALRNENPTEARKIMNSFYRLCGLCERNLYLANDEYWHNKPYTAESEAKEARWIARLKKQLKPYGLTLFFSGYCPSIGIVSTTGGCTEKISRYFYD